MAVIAAKATRAESDVPIEQNRGNVGSLTVRKALVSVLAAAAQSSGKVTEFAVTGQVRALKSPYV